MKNKEDNLKFRTRGDAINYFEQKIGELMQKFLANDDKMNFYELFHGYGEIFDVLKYATDVNLMKKAVIDLNNFLKKFETL